jgi:translation elongation factor aEF-1 beta
LLPEERLPNSCVQTAEKFRSNVTQSAESSADRTSVRNAVSSVLDLVEGQKMGFVVVTYKIFPTDIVEDFAEMKKRLESNIPAHTIVYGYGEELVAYGLKALLVQVKFPEDETGLLDEFETKLEAMEGVSQVETLMVRRTSK